MAATYPTQPVGRQWTSLYAHDTIFFQWKDDQHVWQNVAQFEWAVISEEYPGRDGTPYLVHGGHGKRKKGRRPGAVVYNKDGYTV